MGWLNQAGVSLERDREALRLYFQFNYIPDPWSAYHYFPRKRRAAETADRGVRVRQSG